jgi:hypothetical protein
MLGKIKFVKRGQALAATIDNDDLAAHEWGSDVPNPLDKLRAQDLELPHEVNVLYINSGADYQQGTQKSERQTGSGLSVMTIPLPVVMDDTKAKQVADVNHYNAWVGRTTYTLQLSRKWSKLEPTDVIDVEYGTTTFRMRITKKDDAKPGIIKLECVAEDSAIYTQSGLGAGASNIPTQVVKVPVQTLGMFLDIPILRDADNDAGIYFAACGYRSGWAGCALFKSNDGGATYGQVTSTNDEATIGYCTTALGDFYSGNIFDESNTVTVQMMAGTLSSASELAVLNGANYAVLGNEIIQFKNAELVSAGVYKLSGLLRGRRGTEWAMSSHDVGDRFVLANTATWRRIPLQTSDIGLSRLFKIPSFGTTLQQVAAMPFTAAGISLECYSPVEVGAGRNADGDIIITWKRRGRVNAEWRDYSDIPLGESAESYEIDIMDSTFTSVLGTLNSATNTVTYTVAQQIADLGVLLPTMYMNVYQLSPVVGRGYPAQATVEVKTEFYSTQWRIYITNQLSTLCQIAEVEMMATIGGVDQCNGGSASADSVFTAGWEADKAFDDNIATAWRTTNTPPPHWIQYTFPLPVNVAELAITAYNDNAHAEPAAFNLEYYNGAIWVAVYSASGQYFAISERKTYTI